jgi:SH3 domain protein
MRIMPNRESHVGIWPIHLGRTAVFFIIILAGICWTTETMAQDWYVDVDKKAMLRTGPGNERKIVNTVTTGDRVVAILEEDEGWAHVRLENGKEGWMVKNYLTREIPAHLLLAELQKRHAELERRANRLEEENRQLKSKNEEISTSLSTKTNAMESLSQNYTELKKDADAKSFQMRKYLVFFFSGAGILFIGILLGLVMKRQRRKSSYLA